MQIQDKTEKNGEKSKQRKEQTENKHRKKHKEQKFIPNSKVHNTCNKLDSKATNSIFFKE